MKIDPSETQIKGEWIFKNGLIEGDSACTRIRLLEGNHLNKVAGGGWETLYRDPDDGRLWELTYPQGEMHGGGPPCLTVISHDEAVIKYSIS